MTNLLKIFIGIVFIVHALIHITFLTPAPKDAKAWPFQMTKTWVAPGMSGDLLKTIGTVLIVVALIGFIMAGFAMFGWFVPAAWLQGIIVVSAFCSLLVTTLFWNSSYMVVTVFNLGLIAATLFFNFPQSLLK